jgi:5,10-methylenetetrahydrofolate reductase
MNYITGGQMTVYKSNLHRVLANKKFAVTCEIGPPKSADKKIIETKSMMLKGYADAYNITDNQTAVVRLSSLASSLHVLNQGLEPIYQISCRDRNRIALQSDILGAVSHGISNMLFITGDHQSVGNHPQAKGVFDIDSIQLIQIARNMRDKGIFQNGEPLKSRFNNMFIGGVCNPFATPYEYRVYRLEKKIIAGVDFIQTQSVFNIHRFVKFMDEVRSQGLDKKVFIIAGITPMRSERMLHRMKFHVPGVDIPDEIYYRLLDADDFQQESKDITIDLISSIQEISGVHGIHITALFWESIIPEILTNCGFYPRP